MDYKGHSSAAIFFDVSNDGLLDLFVSNIGVYTSAERGLSGYFRALPDAFSGHTKSDRGESSLLYINQGKNVFKESAAEFNLKENAFNAKSEQWCTAEYSDAYLNNAANNIFGNALYLATAPGKFTESSEQFAAETFWPWGMSVGDVNADGYPDAFITAGMGYGFRYGINSLLLNDAGKRFAPAELVTGVEPRLGNRIRKHAFTLDCSGADKDHPLCQGRTGSLPVSEVLSSRSSAMVDLDNDGDLDLVVNDMDDRPQILINSLAALGDVKWLKVKLRGTTSNRDGLGARITITTAGKSWHQQHDGKSGYLTQSSLPLYLGLGNTEKIDSLEITWPSGTKQKLTELKPNQLLTVQEPAK